MIITQVRADGGFLLWKLSVRSSVANHTMTFFWDQRGSKMKLLDSHEDGYGQGSTTKASSHCTQYKKAQKMKILDTYPCVLSFHIYFVIVFGKQQLTTS